MLKWIKGNGTRAQEWYQELVDDPEWSTFLRQVFLHVDMPGRQYSHWRNEGQAYAWESPSLSKYVEIGNCPPASSHPVAQA